MAHGRPGAQVVVGSDQACTPVLSVRPTIARGIPTLGAAQVCQAREAQGAHHVPRPGWASSLRDHSLRQPQEEGPTSPGGHWSGALQHPTLWPGRILLKVWLCLAMTTDDSLLGGGVP